MYDQRYMRLNAGNRAKAYYTFPNAEIDVDRDIDILYIGILYKYILTGNRAHRKRCLFMKMSLALWGTAIFSSYNL